MDEEDLPGSVIVGAIVVALALLLLLPPGSKKGDIPHLEPTGTFIIPSPVPIPTYTPVPPLPPSDFVVTKVIPLRREPMAFWAWAPDSQRTLVAKPSGNKLELWIQNFDGSGSVRLASDAVTAAWSPDRRYVAYTAPVGTDKRSSEIWLVDIKEMASKRLAQGDTAELQWLPSGEVVFMRDGNLWAVDIDVAEERQLIDLFSLTEGQEVARYGYRVSPDGQKVAFYYTVRIPEEGTFEDSLWLANLDGSSPVLLDSRDGFTIGVPVWSPDGKRMAWAAALHHQVSASELWLINANGTEKREVEADYQLFFNSNISWSPDGRLVTFSGWYGDSDTVLILDVDTGHVTALMPGLDEANNPIWSPDGKKIVYYQVLYHGPYPAPPETVIGQHIVLEMVRK